MVGSKNVRCLLIRHGKTRGNLEGRYVGARTDEGLCSEGRRELEVTARTLGDAPTKLLVFSSPARRCLETAAILFPDATPRVVEDLREIDFGDFEGGNYRELVDDPRYRAWLDSGGTADFPNGEARADFIARCVDAFCATVREYGDEDATLAFVCHGGTAMAIMSSLARGDYFEFQIPNGQGFEAIARVSDDGLDLLSYARVGDRRRS